MKEETDFVPLMVDYREKSYAAGKIPGGFFKREGRPSEKEVLTSRLIDRPIRPLFPKGFATETQIISMVLSADKDYDPDVFAIIAASAALTVSDIPFSGPVAAVRVGRVNGDLIINPTFTQLKESDLNVVVAGTKDEIMMVEGGALELSEEVILEALIFGHQTIKKLVEFQLELQKKIGKEKMVVVVSEKDQEYEIKVRSVAGNKMVDAFLIPEKMERKDKLDKILADCQKEIRGEIADPEADKKISKAFAVLEKSTLRNMVLEKGIRADSRKKTEIRPITSRIEVLPCTHGSALFTRGETQAIVVVTLGTGDDEQMIDGLLGKTSKSFMLHYNFPPFSVGEIKYNLSPGRREIGHGALAERAILPVLPKAENFPYTIRIVSDILESNGSSSMATVCGASLSLMAAGVPIKDAVAGIAMGLIKEGDRIAVLSDIMGLEDHLGDMDFKVAGTAKGITAFQMDIKIDGLTSSILEDALKQAKEGRFYILEKMKSTIDQPRKDISPYAPQIVTLQINKDKVREVIGPGGKVIRSIIEKTGVSINIEDSGIISIASVDEKSVRAAIEMIKNITQEAEIGKIYSGIVKKIVDFGAFVEIFPGTDGLLHISQIAKERVSDVSKYLTEGQEIMVKVLDVDGQGKIKLTHKEL
jgi:polyribonucleotide nucleotidyltransferase